MPPPLPSHDPPLSALFAYEDNFTIFVLDKTSCSLFKLNTVGDAGVSRIKELPASFYSRYASLDEFLSTASSENNNSIINTGERKSTHCKLNLLKEAVTAASTQQSSTKPTKSQQAQNVAKITKKRQVQDAIDEMNRHYDHNTCLDRFMNDIEQNQKKHTTDKQQQENYSPGNSVDRSCHTSPYNSSLCSSSSSMPHSNEDTYSSRNSESIKSSNQESSKIKKNDDTGVNNSNISNSSNASNSSKEDKMPANDKDIIMISKSSKSGDKSHDQFSKHISSIESGIGSSLTNFEDEADSFQSSQNISSSGANSQLDKSKNYKGGTLGRKRKRGYIYNPQPVIEKPPKQFVPEKEKDQSYWDKRQRNNEAAKRSREMRRVKEKETHNKLDQLKKENEALRVAITLLLQRNKNLEFILTEFDKRELPAPVSVSISC